LYGRGSIDDKYAVALSLVLLNAFVEKQRQRGGGQADVPFGILITADEEIGGRHGARAALKRLRTDFCVALDGGNLKKIVVKEKGIMHLRLIARGTAAHAARPWLGENAIEKLIDDYRRIKPFFEETAPDHWHRTCNFSRFQAGNSTNQVPDRAEAFFDIRYTENDDMDGLVEQMQLAVEGELIVEKKEPLFSGGRSAYLDLLLQVCPETAVGSEHGASDARHLSEHGIPGIVWGAEGEMSQHTADEHILIDSIEALYDRLCKFMQRIQDAPGNKLKSFGGQGEMD
jgi:succinyl-diaminopimelate desuccinylase